MLSLAYVLRENAPKVGGTRPACIATERVDQGPDERLAENAHRVVEAHHDADLDFGPAGALYVERQEDEAVEAEEEEEVGDRRPDERLVG